MSRTKHDSDDNFAALLGKIARTPAVSLERAVPRRLAAGTSVGRYSIEVFLGDGGMGVVYRARDERGGPPVALKLIRNSELSRTDLQRFQREAHMLSKVRHPNVVSILEIGDSESGPYVALELLDGQTLRQRLESGSMTVDDVVRTSRLLLDGLIATHACEIVHRDIKPENVFLTSANEIKLLDFGLAKVPFGDPNSRFMTGPGSIVGTPAYMSPELVMGRKIDARSDIFALGAVVYEMLTAQQAFHGADPITTRQAVCFTPYQPIEELNSEVSAELLQWVATCLAKKPEHRYPDAKAALTHLESV